MNDQCLSEKRKPPTALCLFTLHFQPWLFLRRLDELLTREISLVTLVSSLREKNHG